MNPKGNRLAAKLFRFRTDSKVSMQPDAVLWLLLPVFIAGGSALLSYYVMSAKLDVAVSHEREELAEARAETRSAKSTMEERIKATEQEARRKALDEFMQDFRVEERHYFRENRSEVMQKRLMVLQERLYFRNLPLSNWVEHEMVVEENHGELQRGDVQRLAQNCSVFTTRQLPQEQDTPRPRLQPAAQAYGD